MPIRIDLKQNTPEWLEFRSSCLGASDAPIILGHSPWKKADQLFKEKLHPPKPKAPTKSQQYGHDMEAEARDYFESLTGKFFPAVTLIHEEYRWMSASLDGMSLDGKEILEIKNVNLQDHFTALSGSIPKKYYWQCVQQLFVSEADRLYYLSYQKEDPAIVILEPNPDDFTTLLDHLLPFHQRLTKEGFNAP